MRNIFDIFFPRTSHYINRIYMKKFKYLYVDFFKIELVVCILNDSNSSLKNIIKLKTQLII